MSLRTSFQKLIRRDPASSLRARAAALSADLARVSHHPAPEAEAPALLPAPVIGFGADAEIADLATEFCRAYALNLSADRALMAGTGTEAEWRPHYDAVSALMDRLEEAEPKTMLGMALKCLAPIGAAAWDVAIKDAPSEMDRWQRVGAQFEAAILKADLVPLPSFSSKPTIQTPVDDVHLVELGRQFEVARAREIAANEACNAAENEADRHMPERPACLIYRACDARLMVHATMMMGEALDGREIRASDIDWLKRKMPMRHEVLRPIRDGERAHIDHPGRKFDIVPHVEAQARAEEIVAAWEAWQAEQLRVHGEYVTDALDDAANAAGDATAALAGRIAALPARSPAGFRVKLRALAHYNSSFFYSTLPDLPDPDQALSHSLWRDVQDELPASAEPVAGAAAAEDLSKAIINGWAAWGATLGACDDDGEGTLEYERACERRDALLDAAEALPATPENIVAKALARLWMEWVQDERPGQAREAFSFDGRLAFDVNAAIMGGGLLSKDTPKADPIFAAIAISRKAEADMDAFDNDPIASSADGAAETEDRLCDAQTDAYQAVLDAVPTTMAGLRALAEYAKGQNARVLGQDWKAKAETGEFGKEFLSLVAGIEAIHGAPVQADTPVAAENWADAAFEAYAFDTPLRTPAEWVATFSKQALGMHIADKTLRMTKPELTAFILDAVKRDSGVDEAMHQALDCAQSTFEGWGRLLEIASARYLVAALAGRDASEAAASSDPA